MIALIFDRLVRPRGRMSKQQGGGGLMVVLDVT
jgi:hypothetical protein